MELIQSNIQTMSSREIAERTGKTHSNVKRDIATMVLQLNFPDIPLKNCPDFNPSHLKGYAIELKPYSHLGNTYDEFWLDQEMSLLLASGYSVTLRHAIIKRWQEMETKAPALPDFSDPVAAARAWADAKESEQKALESLEAAKPAVEFVETYVKSEGNKGFRQVAKILNANERQFRTFLSDKGIMYRLGGEWVAYGTHINAGRFEMNTGTNGDHAFNTCKFTPKGVQWIAKLWNSREVI